jgi:hypothetical protein
MKLSILIIKEDPKPMVRIEEQITYSALMGSYVSNRKLYIFGILISETKRSE